MIKQTEMATTIAFSFDFDFVFKPVFFIAAKTFFSLF